MKKALFIINPKSGIDRIKALQKTIADNLDTERFQYDLVYTKYPQHGTVLASEGVTKGYDVIVAVGGDGSVNDVVNGLYGRNVFLGIIPKGSGNGLARSLGIPLNEAKAIKNLNLWQPRNIDVGDADGHLFVSNAGVGFDTIVTDKFRNSKRRGLPAYLTIILKNIWSYQSHDWLLEIDGAKKRSRSFMLTIANGVQLGYGFQIAPHARPDDGFFDLVCIRKFPKLFAAAIAFRAFTGTILKSPYVTTQKVKQIIIRHPGLNLLQIDGEALVCNTSVVIKIAPHQLQVLCPPQKP